MPPRRATPEVSPEVSPVHMEVLADMLMGLSPANGALRKAAGRGDCDAMRAALAQGADVEFREQVRARAAGKMQAHFV